MTFCPRLPYLVSELDSFMSLVASAVEQAWSPSHFTQRRKLICILPCHTCHPIWMKFSATDLHAVLFSICDVSENLQVEGRTTLQPLVQPHLKVVPRNCVTIWK
jgi:hypothetical protein